MNLLIKSAKIIDVESQYHNTTQDILIENGSITQISKSLTNPKNYDTISLKNLHLSQGWFDSSVSFGEPGYEERETIENGLKTAAKSGFTAVAVNPNTHPIIDTNADVAFLKTKAQENAVDLYPIGALTLGSEGNHLAELYDMQNAGAIAFSDYKKGVSNANLLKIALQYAQSFDGLVCSFPQESCIAGKGMINEGATSTTLGLKGIPALAETLQITRDLFILEYTSGKLHIPTISTAGSVELIRNAKKKGLQVSCSVAIHNLLFTDAILNDFDTNGKVLPPLRTDADRKALVKGLQDGTIDMVTTDHNPINIEHKKVEFDHALFGTIGLESAFGALSLQFSVAETVNLLTRRKKIFGIDETHPIKIGSLANITLFNPDEKYVFSENDILSTSKNSAFLGAKLQGKVHGIIANNQYIIN